MKINNKSLDFTNQNIRNKPLSIPFYMQDSEKKESPSDYQTYKLLINPKNKKLAVYILLVKYYNVGTPEEWLQFMEAIMQAIKGQDIQDKDAVYLLVKSLLKGGTLQVFKNKEASQEVKDSLVFTKCLAAVTKQVFPKKAYKRQKKSSSTYWRMESHISGNWSLRKKDSI
eukprot:10053948-Ditylum_brightwellii.AAC.1